jgi:dihydroorotate dehydrogenase
MYSLAKQILFAIDAEKAHHLTFHFLKKIQNTSLQTIFIPKYKYKNPINIAGFTFPNRLGLAAGLDKNALLLPVWQRLGFGHIEVGTITPKPQIGNPKPRLFRLVKDEALINRMGFNNDGADLIAHRLSYRPTDLIIGANIGKNKDTTAKYAFRDYQICMQKLQHVCDYFTINVSSPNTPGLRDLQHQSELDHLLGEIQNTNQAFKVSKPIWLKIAPDLSEIQLQDVISVAEKNNINAIVATNTTLSRSGLLTDATTIQQIGNGGLSGKPLFKQSNEIVNYIHQNSSIPVIGVGGIFSGEDALEKVKAGASLVQIYSGLIYKGPYLIKEILQALQEPLTA